MGSGRAEREGSNWEGGERGKKNVGTQRALKLKRLLWEW